MNKPATKGDVIVWSFLILGSAAKTDTLAVTYAVIAMVVLFYNIWFAKD